MRDVSPCSESIKVRCGRQASLHRDPFIECNALGNSPTILRCAKPSLLLRDYANYMKPGSRAASARHGGCAPCIILYFLVDFSSLLTSYPCHFIAYRKLSTTSSTEYCWTTGITTRAGPQAGTLLPSENGRSEPLIDGRVRGGVLHLPSEPSKFFFILRLRFAVDKLCPI